MLEHLVGKKVGIELRNYQGNPIAAVSYKGTVTACDDLFITLDNNLMVAIKYIGTIRILG